jgi:hypothetical protein
MSKPLKDRFIYIRGDDETDKYTHEPHALKFRDDYLTTLVAQLREKEKRKQEQQQQQSVSDSSMTQK